MMLTVLRDRFIFSAALLILTAGSVSAHDLWIESAPGASPVLRYGHYGNTSDEIKYIPFLPSDVKSVICAAADGSVISRSGKLMIPEPWSKDSVQHEDPHHHHEKIPAGFITSFRMPENCSVMTADFSTGYWTKTPAGLKNLPESAVKTPVRSWYAHESIKFYKKGLLAENAAGLSLPFTEGLEIVTVSFSGKDRLLKIKVLYKGKAVSGAKTEYQGTFTGETDKDGTFTFRLDESGVHYIRTSHKDSGVKGSFKNLILTAALIAEE